MTASAKVSKLPAKFMKIVRVASGNDNFPAIHRDAVATGILTEGPGGVTIRLSPEFQQYVRTKVRAKPAKKGPPVATLPPRVGLIVSKIVPLDGGLVQVEAASGRTAVVRGDLPKVVKLFAKKGGAPVTVHFPASDDKSDYVAVSRGNDVVATVPTVKDEAAE